MTPEAERIARATRAQAAWDEFVAPLLNELRVTYSERMVDVANSELNHAKRADKITALSNAVRILAQLEGGMKAIIMDGEIARRDELRADKIEGMTRAQRRLLGVAPY